MIAAFSWGLRPVPLLQQSQYQAGSEMAPEKIPKMKPGQFICLSAAVDTDAVM
jgi:hypothetical protein